MRSAPSSRLPYIVGWKHELNVYPISKISPVEYAAGIDVGAFDSHR